MSLVKTRTLNASTHQGSFQREPSKLSTITIAISPGGKKKDTQTELAILSTLVL